METPENIKKIDWTDLRTQKTLLLQTINNKAVSPMHKEGLEGILALIDALQDYAVDEMNVDPMHVFDFEEEDIRDGYTGINDAFNNPIQEGNKIVHLCGNCNSDNVEMKKWVNANTDKVGDFASDGDDDDVWCNDCETHGGIYVATLKPDAKVIGFQVVGEEGTLKEGEIHPDMDASFCIYSLSQAKEMLEDNENGHWHWRLLTIWEGDVEEPTFIFKGDPRQ